MIDEHADADWLQMQCRGEPIRHWMFDGREFQQIVSARNGSFDSMASGGLCYEVGHVQFHLSTDRKRVLFIYHFGPRYARWRTYEVRGQGTDAKFVQYGIESIS